jgi:hypothetical protein
MNEEIRFEVGEKYENMKGTFEVVSIHRGQMEIRWETGEEVSTSVALQQRIIERMQHEKELEIEQLAQKKKAKASSLTVRKPFSGLELGDFSLVVSKTAWRGRGQLGGIVARKLTSKSFKFNSWAVLRKPEIHWLDIDRQKQKDLAFQAKYYARVDNDNLFFGFHVPHPDPSTPETSDWTVLLTWLEKPENDAWLLKQCVSHEIYLCDLSEKGFVGRLEAGKDQWEHCQEDKKTVLVDSLGSFLATMAKGGEFDLRIEKRMEKQTAIAKKQNIAADLVALFGSLGPLYSAAALRNA